jgi:hypothetical protein
LSVVPERGAGSRGKIIFSNAARLGWFGSYSQVINNLIIGGV